MVERVSELFSQKRHIRYSFLSVSDVVSLGIWWMVLTPYSWWFLDLNGTSCLFQGLGIGGLYRLWSKGLVGVRFHLLERFADIMRISSRIHLCESFHDELLFLHISPMLLIILLLEHQGTILSNDRLGLLLLFWVVLEDLILIINFFFCNISEVIWEDAFDWGWRTICLSESMIAAWLATCSANNQLSRRSQLILLEHIVWILSKFILKNKFKISKGEIW